MSRSAAYARGHKETSTTGKWDPGGYDLDSMRSALATQLGQSGSDDEVKPTDVVGNDVDGTTMTMGELAARMDWLYRQFLEAGVINQQLDRIEENTRK